MHSAGLTPDISHINSTRSMSSGSRFISTREQQIHFCLSRALHLSQARAPQLELKPPSTEGEAVAVKAVLHIAEPVFVAIYELRTANTQNQQGVLCCVLKPHLRVGAVRSSRRRSASFPSALVTILASALRARAVENRLAVLYRSAAALLRPGGTHSSNAFACFSKSRLHAS